MVLGFLECNSKNIPGHIAPTPSWVHKIANALISFSKAMRQRKLKLELQEILLADIRDATNKTINILLVMVLAKYILHR
ncbi:MAG: hypothetical protein ACTS7E_04980 [Arsenophonus sp. NC-CH8-MAG3]